MIVAGLALCHLLLAAAPAGADAGAGAGQDAFSGAVEVRRFSFEADEDRDFDDFPDDWRRRKGPDFPAYVPAAIDRGRGFDGERSLRFDSNGAQAAMYAPPIHVDALHSYVFRGRIGTQLLEHDAAAVSVSFLNHKRQRIARLLGPPVTGTHDGWVEVRIGPAAPPPATRFIVIGCHLLRGKRLSIRGAAWFDDLWLGRLPQLAIEDRYASHFVTPGEAVRIATRASGLEAGHAFRLKLQVRDEDGLPIESQVVDLDLDADRAADSDAPRDRELRTEWRLEPREHGHYRVRATLERDGVEILEQRTAFVALDFIEQNGRGEFGWSIAGDPREMSPRELAAIAAQSGINWLKFPLWPTARIDDPVAAVRTAELLELLAHRRIRTVGLLDAPPPELREKFARDWTGISEVFTLSPDFWRGSLEAVIARYSSNVRYWQLGGESDFSFNGMQRLPETLATVKREFDRIGQDTRIGVPWSWDVPLPNEAALPRTFLAFNSRDALSPDELADNLRRTKGVGPPRWVSLRALPSGEHGDDERGADLVRQMVAAKVGGAEAIFFAETIDDERGLLRRNGAPGALFLPWRTTATALQGAELLGSLHLPGGSTNHVFSNGGEVLIVVWADEPGFERTYLGENVGVTDMWGRREAAEFDEKARRHVIPVGPLPRILRNCSAEIIRWQLAVRFEQGRAESSTGDYPDAIVGINPFSQGVGGEVRLSLPPEWQARPDRWTIQAAAGEEFRLPVYLTLPPNATLGVDFATIDFEIVADRPYRFRVHRPYQVGLGDMGIAVVDRVLDDGRLEIEQVITNDIEPIEVLDLRCSLFVPGRKRQTLIVTKLGRGQDRKFFHVPDGKALDGQGLWIRAEQIGGNRVLNYKWRVGDGRE
ncbi:MAG: hypothetical protein WD066_15330 [Planctomycetaceae bacterium]